MFLRAFFVEVRSKAPWHITADCRLAAQEETFADRDVADLGALPRERFDEAEVGAVFHDAAAPEGSIKRVDVAKAEEGVLTAQAHKFGVQKRAEAVVRPLTAVCIVKSDRGADSGKDPVCF